MYQVFTILFCTRRNVEFPKWSLSNLECAGPPQPAGSEDGIRMTMYYYDNAGDPYTPSSLDAQFLVLARF